jgi:hypothetical protein
MELFEPVPKKIKSSDKDQNILDQENEQLIKQLVKNKLMKSMTEVVNLLVNNLTINIECNINPKLLMRINTCEAKEAFLQSNIDRSIEYKESLLTDDIKQLINKSISHIKEHIIDEV